MITKTTLTSRFLAYVPVLLVTLVIVPFPVLIGSPLSQNSNAVLTVYVVRFFVVPVLVGQL